LGCTSFSYVLLPKTPKPHRFKFHLNFIMEIDLGAEYDERNRILKFGSSGFQPFGKVVYG